MKRAALSAVSVLALSLAACGGGAGDDPVAAPTTEAASGTAFLDDPSRTASDREADPLRKPAEMLEFAGLTSGQTVFEMLPGGGYFTRIFALATGPDGKVVLYAPDEMADKPWKPIEGAEELAAEMGDPRITATHFPVAGPVPEDMAGTVDLVWTSRNYHDFHNLPGFDPVAYNAMVLDLLKPGGTYVVLDHSAPAGSGAGATDTTHRIDADFVKAEIEKAGFEFVGETDVLANPDDTRDANVHDKAIKGRTDQFVLKFRKPG
ncbi:class I SAM-dependent methyltransferase [Croceicoccus sediminis]|uniref:class I SAM-dependent methyltransferase n=1 Tax=Croceicoccus sediminis TaxID=2571150 RepID=UPI001183749D|nr:class I SAM-dependent methyltransferase [Croceicoccus sediminis]